MQNHPSHESSKEASYAPETDSPGDGIADSDLDLLAMAYREAIQARLTGAVGGQGLPPGPNGR
jgi:hypothetical protein